MGSQGTTSQPSWLLGQFQLVGEKTWVGREIGKIWEELGKGKSMIKIFCMALM